ncbi:AbrB/MazE/SpoVT family DNA-binding domain-containing protein [Paenibacillus whitsoniae]|uniref:AbrB/MazE/SpoVT family DNA-binding domain-containing protein n=1 Tax=Paenibacillus whitsoniae TaxID=2496558 RepID=A0A3S0ACP5_9BACL|nr:AbrB/MazE/SpoVT family DNA-binding domain-containing protein [Paenibacillus whitsoniae]RTE09941.1 AbrB/MazE/SpoVT family DNA-binding domain-containing protein [Paenibacillus whitsoniae]
MANAAWKEVSNVQKFVRLRKKAQLTIPTEIVEQLHLNEGDNLNIQVEDGRIILIPTVTIAKDQAWFWTESWQQGERQAERDAEKGRLTDISDEKELDAFFDTLDK